MHHADMVPPLPRLALMVLLCIALATPVFAGDSEADAAGPTQILYPNLAGRLARELQRDLKCKKGPDLKLLREVGEEIESSDESAYGWTDFYHYAIGVHLAQRWAAGHHGKGNEAGEVLSKAQDHLDVYLTRLADVPSTASLPTEVVSDPRFKSARGEQALKREIILKRWADHRWSLGGFKVDQIGWEYRSALSMRLQLADSRSEVDRILAARTETGHEKNSCAEALGDAARLFAIQRHLQLGAGPSDDRVEALLGELESSKGTHPVSPELLQHLREPPALLLGFRPRALIVLGGLLTLLAASMWLFRLLRKRRADADPDWEPALDGDFAVHRRDPLARFTMHWLGLTPLWAYLSTLLFLGGGLFALTWAENSCRMDSFVVDRAFLDYLSFTYGFVVLIPAFLAAAVFLYSAIAKQLPRILAASFCGQAEGEAEHELPKAVTGLWAKFKGFCDSTWLTATCATAALLLVAFQQWQWAKDPGTAFVDLRYPGYWSLTAIYYKVAMLVVIHSILTCVVRGCAVFFFIARVYGRKWRARRGVEISFHFGHVDNCCGMRPLGWVLLLFYVLLLLLIAQILLNMVEKLRFYESLDVVLGNTLVSVVVFGVGFLILMPIVVGPTIISVHLAMKAYRLKERARVRALSDVHTARMAAKVGEGTVAVADVQAFQAMRALEAEAAAMPVWPFDMKVLVTFAASHAVPAVSFVVPFLGRQLGLI